MRDKLITVFLYAVVILVLYALSVGVDRVWGEVAGDNDNLDSEAQKALTASVASVLKEAREKENVTTVPLNNFNEEGIKRAQQSAKTFNTPEFQGRITSEKQRLDREVFKKYSATATCENKITEEQKTDSPDSPDSLEALASEKITEKIYLFVSSSLPDETMHSYLSDITRSGDSGLVSIIPVIPVMRGMVNGIKDKKANRKYFSKILKEDMGCIDDYQQKKSCERFETNILFQPPLFTKYGIERVPALVYDNEDQVFIIQGDAALDYLLERINREAKQERLENLIGTLRGKINE